MSVENTNKKGTQEGGSQKGRGKGDCSLIPSEPQIWLLTTISDGTCYMKQGDYIGSPCNNHE